MPISRPQWSGERLFRSFNTHGGQDMFAAIAFVLSTATAVVLYRRRYRGIRLARSASGSGWGSAVVSPATAGDCADQA